MLEVLILIALVVVPAHRVARRAHRRGAPAPLVALVLVLHAAGMAALLVGLFALMWHGYEEDYGSGESQTLHIAIPLLVASAIAFGAAWTLASRDRAGDG